MWAGIEYYCPMHTKPYDDINNISIVDKFGRYLGCREVYYKRIPEHLLEVDVNGKEIKKKSKK